MNCHDNSVSRGIKNNTVIPMTNIQFGTMNIDEWTLYLVDHKIDYDEFLKNDKLLKTKIFEVYKNDVIYFKYEI